MNLAAPENSMWNFGAAGIGSSGSLVVIAAPCNATRGAAEPMVLLWRRDGGGGALERVRIQREELGRTPWLVVDRKRRSVFLGDAACVWRVVDTQRLRLD